MPVIGTVTGRGRTRPSRDPAGRPAPCSWPSPSTSPHLPPADFVVATSTTWNGIGGAWVPFSGTLDRRMSAGGWWRGAPATTHPVVVRRSMSRLAGIARRSRPASPFVAACRIFSWPNQLPRVTAMAAAPTEADHRVRTLTRVVALAIVPFLVVAFAVLYPV